ncbi:hypothetical protein VPHK460_0125 [Vibrio phage K460]
MVTFSLYNVYNKSGNTSEAVIVADLSLNGLVAIKCACHSGNCDVDHSIPYCNV